MSAYQILSPNKPHDNDISMMNTIKVPMTKEVIIKLTFFHRLGVQSSSFFANGVSLSAISCSLLDSSWESERVSE